MEALKRIEQSVAKRVNGILASVTADLAGRLDLDLDDDESEGETVAEATGIDEGLLDDYYWFDGPNALAEAAGAFREVGADGDRVWHHPKAQLAFFGGIEDFEAWCDEKRVDPDDFTCYANANQVFKLDYDTGPILELIEEARSGGRDEARQDYTRFRWGKEAHGVGVITISGVEKPLALLGHLTGLQWVSDRMGTMRLHDYDHDEADGPLPMIFQVDRKTYLIHTKAQTANEIIAAASKERVSKEEFARYTWDASIPEIDGITARLAVVGFVTGVQYLADKADGPHDYDHEHGETTDVLPTLYRLDEHTLIVHGDEVDIREEGICD